MFFNQNANNLNRVDYVRSTNQAVLHQEQSIFQVASRGRRTEAQVRHHLRPGELLRLHDRRHRPSPRRKPAAIAASLCSGSCTVDWNTPVSNRLLIEASGIHRVERWGGMDPQAGKLGNVDLLTPGMIRSSTPSTR